MSIILAILFSALEVMFLVVWAFIKWLIIPFLVLIAIACIVGFLKGIAKGSKK